MRHAIPIAIVTVIAAAGCQPPSPATTERIIRIQIEGCEDAAPLPIAATPTPLAIAPTAPPAVTEVATRAPIDTPVAMQTRVPRTPEPPPRTSEQLAEDFTLKRESFDALLATSKHHPLDVPAATESVRRADEFIARKNYDEATRYIEVALLQAKEVKINEAFLEKKFKRVEARFAEVQPSMRDVGIKNAQNGIARAQAAFLANNFKLANSILYEVDVLLDRRAAKGNR